MYLWCSGSLPLRVLDHKQGNSPLLSLPLVPTEEETICEVINAKSALLKLHPEYTGSQVPELTHWLCSGTCKLSPAKRLNTRSFTVTIEDPSWKTSGMKTHRQIRTGWSYEATERNSTFNATYHLPDPHIALPHCRLRQPGSKHHHLSWSNASIMQYWPPKHFLFFCF